MRDDDVTETCRRKRDGRLKIKNGCKIRLHYCGELVVKRFFSHAHVILKRLIGKMASQFHFTFCQKNIIFNSFEMNMNDFASLKLIEIQSRV